MRARVSLLAPWLCATLLVVACDEEKTGDGSEDTTEKKEREHGLTKKEAKQPLVEVGDTTITVGEFADRLAEQSPYLRARYNSPERRREFLDNIVRFELLAAEAERRGLDELPEVRRTVEQKMIQQMMKERFEDRIKLSDISDEAIRKYYEAHKDEFHKPKQVRASHILFKDPRKARRVLQELRDNPNDVKLFREMAEKYNRDPDTKEQHGDLRFFTKPEKDAADEGAAEKGAENEEPSVPDAVAEAAFEIERIGQVYPELVRTGEGWHIVRLTARRAALQRSLEEARRPIQNRLWREKRQAAVDRFVQKLRKNAEIEENFEALDDVRIELPDGGQKSDEGTPSDEAAQDEAAQDEAAQKDEGAPGETPSGEASQ